MPRRYATKYRRASHRDAIGESKRAAAEAAGIAMRAYDDPRTSIELNLSHVGGAHIIIEPRRGHILQWRARDSATGDVLHGGALKTVLHAIADALPRAQVIAD